MKQYSILICLFIGLFCSNPAFAQKSVDDYAKQFAKQTKELEKMQVIIDAVNDGLIKVGAPIENIDRILGRKNLTYGAKVILYHPFDKSKKLNSSQGWYLAYTVNPIGASIDDYELTNTYPYSQHQSSTQLLEMIEKYGNADSENSRIQVCIDAMASKQIQTGLPVADLLRIFHASQATLMPDEKIHKLYFKQSGEPTANISHGWYFAYTSEDGNKTVKNYWLSNVSGGTDAVAAQIFHSYPLRGKTPKTEKRLLKDPP